MNRVYVCLDNGLVPTGQRDYPSLATKDWTYVAIEYLIESVKERIERYDIIIFKQQHWEMIKEHVVRDHPSETRKFWTQVMDKRDNFKWHYHKEKKIHNVSGDNAR